MNEIKLTDGRKALIKSLAEGVKSWSELRMSYYGPERYKSKASTSFTMQLTKLKMMNVIEVNPEGKYTLGSVGKELFEQHRDEIMSGCFISKAQQLYTSKCDCETPCEECKCQEEVK